MLRGLGRYRGRTVDLPVITGGDPLQSIDLDGEEDVVEEGFGVREIKGCQSLPHFRPLSLGAGGRNI